MATAISRRTMGCAIAFALLIFLFRDSLAALVNLSTNREQYSHILFAPLLCAGFLYWYRKDIFSQPVYSWPAGLFVLSVGLATHPISGLWPAHSYSGHEEGLTIAISIFVLLSVAIFVFFYGSRTLSAARFPLFLCLLFIPLPASLVQNAVLFLQNASADWTYGLFHLTSMPVLREGMTFMLPGATIEVAEECSGIRASTALLIASVVLSHLFLRYTWSRMLLVLVALPLAILKNAIRITAISWLGVYVSPEYFHGSLHHSGGPLFAALALCILIPILLGLQRLETAVHKTL